MSLLIVGGDSIEALRKRARIGGLRHVEHWSGRKTRDLGKTIPKETTVVVVILDRVNHAFVEKGTAGIRSPWHSSSVRTAGASNRIAGRAVYESQGPGRCHRIKRRIALG